MSTETILTINVGGATFQTSKSTLTRFDGFFKTMLETEDVPITKDEFGSIFIDRDSTHFRRILNYMRDGELKLPESTEDIKEILKEAEYYKLDGLMKMCSNELNEREISRIQKEIERLSMIMKADEKKIEEISDIKVLETHREYLRVMGSKNPCIIIYQEVNAFGQTIRPDGFSIEKFVETYKGLLDIYFKPFNSDNYSLNSNPTEWAWSLHQKTAYQYCYFRKGATKRSWLRCRNRFRHLFEFFEFPAIFSI